MKCVAIDLFCGIGGLTYGIRQTGIDVAAGIDIDSTCRYAYEENNKSVFINKGIEEVKKEEIQAYYPKDCIKILMGCAPCQPFSNYSLRYTKEGPKDEKWKLLYYFRDLVKEVQPEIISMENVPQLLNSEEFHEIEKYAAKLGFTHLAKAKLCAADYGVPQVRYRAFIIGCKFVDPTTVFPPLKTHYNPESVLPKEFSAKGYALDAKPWKTVRDAIGDLPAPQGVEIRKGIAAPLDLHFGRTPTEISLKRYKAIPEEGMNRFDLQRNAPELTPKCWINKKSGGTDLFGRLWWDKPSVTIRTEFFKPEKGRYLHPSQHRPITHREAARIQSFPDSFKFKGSKIEIAKQIGNAVPPLLAAQVAECVEQLLEMK